MVPDHGGSFDQPAVDDAARYTLNLKRTPHHGGKDCCVGTVGKRLDLGVLISGQSGGLYPPSALISTIAKTKATRMKAAEILYAIPDVSQIVTSITR